MKTEWSEEFKCNIELSETPLEALDSLQTFFEADMWYAMGAEWNAEADMLQYLKSHFDICRKSIEQIEGGIDDGTDGNNQKKKEKDQNKKGKNS